jgi:plastocyanin
MRAITLALLLTALAVGAAACGGGSNGGGSSYGSGGSGSDTTSASGSGKTELELDDNYFKPATVKGAPGDSITLELKNEGMVEHNFSLSDQGIDQDVEPGEEAEVDVTIPQSGSVSFFCKYHKSEGMTGTLEASG